MTEEYWRKYKNKYDNEVFQKNEFWRDVKADMKKKEKGKHYKELYTICKSENPYIRQIRNSPNITIDGVAEIICRDIGCDLQYCMSLQNKVSSNSKSVVDLNGCKFQYSNFTNCLKNEKFRLRNKEKELLELVNGMKERNVLKNMSNEQFKTEIQQKIALHN